MSPDTIRDRIANLSWWHSINLGHGIVTPGRWGPPAPIISQAFDTVDFKGKKVIDIGCLDGLWSFEAERRGASEVYATDDVTQRNYAAAPTLQIAKEILGSRVKYFPDVSVFKATERFPKNDFDIVIFAGVFYHLKDPILALARLRQLLKLGGVIIVEGAIIANREETYATFHYRDVFANDESNWWVPTLQCLREWVECSFFEVRSEHLPSAVEPSRGRFARKFRSEPVRFTRAALTAAAVVRADPLYNCPDENLREFDRNQYPSERL